MWDGTLWRLITCWQTDEVIITQWGEYTLPISRATPLARQKRIRTIYNLVDGDLLADMYYIGETSSPRINNISQGTDIAMVDHLTARPVHKNEMAEPMQDVTPSATNTSQAPTSLAVHQSVNASFTSIYMTGGRRCCSSSNSQVSRLLLLPP